MHTVKLGDLRATLANMPDDAVLTATGVSGEIRLLLCSAEFDADGVPLELIRSGESPHRWNERRLARIHEQIRVGRIVCSALEANADTRSD